MLRSRFKPSLLKRKSSAMRRFVRTRYVMSGVHGKLATGNWQVMLNSFSRVFISLLSRGALILFFLICTNSVFLFAQILFLYLHNFCLFICATSVCLFAHILFLFAQILFLFAQILFLFAQILFFVRTNSVSCANSFFIAQIVFMCASSVFYLHNYIFYLHKFCVYSHTCFLKGDASLFPL